MSDHTISFAQTGFVWIFVVFCYIVPRLVSSSLIPYSRVSRTWALVSVCLRRICTVLDKTSMFGVTSTKKDGEQKRHHVSKAGPLKHAGKIIVGRRLPSISSDFFALSDFEGLFQSTTLSKVCTGLVGSRTSKRIWRVIIVMPNVWFVLLVAESCHSPFQFCPVLTTQGSLFMPCTLVVSSCVHCGHAIGCANR